MFFPLPPQNPIYPLRPSQSYNSTHILWIFMFGSLQILLNPAITDVKRLNFLIIWGRFLLLPIEEETKKSYLVWVDFFYAWLRYWGVQLYISLQFLRKNILTHVIPLYLGCLKAYLNQGQKKRFTARFNVIHTAIIDSKHLTMVKRAKLDVLVLKMEVADNQLIGQLVRQ